MPCVVNGLALNMIFDTGAADVSLSQVEAQFMLKNGYLSHSDFGGKEEYLNADGLIYEGTALNLREIVIAGLVLKNVKASVTSSIKAPLLLGQSAISRFDRFTVDYNAQTISIYPIANIPNVHTYPNATAWASGPSAYIPRAIDTGDTITTTVWTSTPLRSGSGISYKPLLIIKQSDTVAILDRGDMFYKARVNGITGYVAKAFLNLPANPPLAIPSSSSYYSPGSDVLYTTSVWNEFPFMARPDISSDRLFMMKKGHVIEILERGSIFHKARINGITGYASKVFLNHP